MTKLEYPFTNDMLFKTLFVKRQDLLKRLVAELLKISFESIGQFDITNPEIQPNLVGEKFCRLDISMKVNGERVDLEIQVANEGDYPERSLYYWAREYSSALGEGGDYKDLPRTVVISIVAFKLFDCTDFHSEFQPLEVTRHTPLTNRMSLHYFELPKLPEAVSAADDGAKLWLALFRAKTEEDLKRIQDLGVPVMEQAIDAYRHVTTAEEFREMERMWSRARSNETAALRHARTQGAETEREKWQGVVAEKDAALTEKDVMVAEQAAALAEQAALIAELRKQIRDDS